MTSKWQPPPSYWDQPGMECMPCRGRGWVIQEDATGMPGQEVTCPYCHGKGTSWWVAGRKDRRLGRFTRRRLVVLGLALGLAMTGNLWPPLDDYTTFSSYMFVLHLGLWIALLVAWIKSPPRRRVVQAAGGGKGGRPRHAPGFDTPREAKFLAGFGAAVGLRSLWDSSHRRGF